MNFDEFFKAATGHAPFDYQRLLAGGNEGCRCESKLINVPTGLGKTAAVVLAWLWNRVELNRSDWPRRLVYCLPMRTLVEQTRDEAEKWLKAHGRLWDGKGTRDGKVGLHILMGGEDAGEWDIHPEREAILIGTQDMLLSRALNRGYGMSRYRWPMHFGLLNNDCLWVMDETQLMGPGLWTSGQLDWMRNHRFGVMKPCVTWWMSATNSPAFLDTPDRRKQQLTTLPVLEVGDEPKAVARLNPTRPVSFWRGSEAKTKAKKKSPPAPTFDEALAAAIRADHTPGTLSLVVCNSVKAAQQLYRLLGGENAVLLTSRFRRGDRDKHTKRLLAFEQKRKAHNQGSGDDTLPDSPGLICISTQVVEAGVDISARRLWLEAAPWPSALQRFGRLNRDGRADGKAKAFVFQWPDEGRKGKGQPIGPYDAKDLEASLKLLIKLAAIYEAEPKIRAKAALDQLRDSCAAAMDAALKPKEEPFPRAMDVHGLFSSEPDLFGGFTDVSPWVRGDDKNADVTVFWREFDAKKGPGKTADLTGPAFDVGEGCAVAIHRFRDDFLSGRGRALVWDERSETWSSTWASEICPGMVVMLPRAAGGYSASLGWTGQSADKLDTAPPPGRFSDTFEGDAASEHAEWVTLETHLADAKVAASRITKALQLDSAIQTAVVTAAEWHDIGKSHSIWQAALPTTGEMTAQLWAKAPSFKCLPRPSPNKPCIRHEAASALAAWSHYFADRPGWPGLAVFLIACHHGKVRTALYARGDDGEDICGVPKEPAILPWNGGMPMDFSCAAVGTGGEFSEDGLTFTPASPGWTAFVADLLGGWELRPQESPPPNALRAATEPRLLGPFALAYLESLICAADIQASQNPSQVRHV